MFNSIFSINVWHKLIWMGDLYNLTLEYTGFFKIIFQDMNAPSHKGQNKFSHSRAQLSSSHVIPPRSPSSRSGRVPQQPSARGGEFSEPGIDSKNILNDLNRHQDAGLVMALQISKFQMETFWRGPGSIVVFPHFSDSNSWFFWFLHLIFFSQCIYIAQNPVGSSSHHVCGLLCPRRFWPWLPFH